MKGKIIGQYQGKRLKSGWHTGYTVTLYPGGKVYVSMENGGHWAKGKELTKLKKQYKF